jgi:hypothetical protein
MAQSQIADEMPPGEPVRSEFGRGRVVYIPRVNPAIAKPPSESMISAYWKLPLNWREIVESLRWAAGGLSMEVEAPATVIAEAMEQKNAKKLLVHLLNYDVAHTPAVSNIGLKLRFSEGVSPKTVTLLSPDNPNVQTLPHRVVAGLVQFVIPRLATYDLAIIQTE